MDAGLEISSSRPALFLCSCHLPFLHPLPADETIQVIDQKHHKTDDHRQVADILHRRQDPQDDQHHFFINPPKQKISPRSHIF